MSYLRPLEPHRKAILDGIGYERVWGENKKLGAHAGVEVPIGVAPAEYAKVMKTIIDRTWSILEKKVQSRD